MKEVLLTKGKVAFVDDEDFERVSAFKWCASFDGRSNWYAKRTIRLDGKKSVMGMHRFILNAPQGYVVDHINGNTLDNTRKNLRIVTAQQNNANRVRPRDNIGIRFIYGKWRAQISFNNRSVYLGGFNTKQDASTAYKDARKRLFSI